MNLLIDTCRATTRIGALFLVAALLATASNLPVVHAQSSTLNTRAWTASVSGTNPNQPSGSATTVTIIFNVLQSVYDLQITVTGQDLSISNNLGSGNSYTWGLLNEGDARQIQFLVTTPSEAPVGNRYNVTVQTQSYSTPAGLFGARLPFDSPSDKASTSFLLYVTPVQVIEQQAGGAIDWGPIAAVAVGVSILVVVLLYIWSRNSW